VLTSTGAPELMVTFELAVIAEEKVFTPAFEKSSA